MAKCPKCGKKLRFIDISQFCPACGVNMRFCGFEENFFKEAKLAELTQAVMHVKLKHLKAAYIGSKLAIMRLVAMFLPVAALLIPNGSVSVVLPFRTTDFTFNLMGVMSALTGEGASLLASMSGSELFGAPFSELKTLMLVYAVSVALAALILLLSLLCFISYKNMQKILCVLAAAGVLSSVTAMIMISRFTAHYSEAPLMQVSGGFGLIAAALMFAVVFVVNFLLVKKGIPVEYGEGMAERVAIYRRMKAGKVSLDDLPQPVVETAQTRAIDDEIRKEEEAFMSKHGEAAL